MAHGQCFSITWPCHMSSSLPGRIGAPSLQCSHRAVRRQIALHALSPDNRRGQNAATLQQARGTSAWRPPITPPSQALGQAPQRQLELWQCLLQAGASKMLSSVDEVNSTASEALEKLSRYILPPPPGFPPGPSGDQSVPLLSDALGFLTSTSSRYGGVAGMLLGGERVVLVTDSAAARQVMIEQPDVFGKEGTAFFPGSSLTGNGLLTSDGDSWRRQRRLSNPAFRRAAVERYAAEMARSAADLVDGPWAAAAAAVAAAAAAPQPTAGADSGSGRPSRQQVQQQIQQRGQQQQELERQAEQRPGVRDVYADFNALTLRITLAALFGIGGSASSSSSSSATSSSRTSNGSMSLSTTSSNDTAAQIVSSVERAFKYLARRGTGIGMLIPEWLPTADNVEFGAAVAQLDGIVYGIIAQRRVELARAAAEAATMSVEAGADDARAASTHRLSGAARSDLLQALLEAVDEDGQGMTDRALRDELMTLLVAGQETSAILLGWASALLAHNPTAQARAAEEVASVLQGRPVDAAAARQLPYIEAAVLEALRMYSPAYMVGRCASMDVTLRTKRGATYQLPAGTTMLVSPYVMHRDPAHWEQPEVFMPERWLQFQQAGQGSSGGGGGSAALLRDMGPNGAFLPFGAGPRNCIGTGFAMMEAILVLAAVLQHYELAPPAPGAPFPQAKPVLTLRPDAVHLHISPRRCSAVEAQPKQQASEQGLLMAETPMSAATSSRR